ncbi:GNAT family N-acetyltransferase [Niveispirillum sp. BGYR6]|uniref:acyl-homoserine-lactone synthase n=1 Tax=Niveispirillum sp. BGYR6 TaxID=2971249 RepID=UPI0022B95CE6|nr:GNAT family N-acetyltransferase [Niveispirillum sp. BGYR6]MDG5493572.1 GNAT family N-acetyltransferase [Niveispirillum sp. BGYR6]
MQELKIFRFRAGEAPEYMAQAWRLRHQVFRETLGWSVRSLNQLEIDQFDKMALHCVAVERDVVVGYWRSLRTTEPYLLEQYFPDLLEGRPLPKRPDIWEISRFAVAPSHPRRRDVGKSLALEIGRFGFDQGASRLIAVVEPPFGRFIRACGLPVTQDVTPVVVGTGSQGDVIATIITLDMQTYAQRLGAAACQAQIAAA